jgi:hypothetical protein
MVIIREKVKRKKFTGCLHSLYCPPLLSDKIAKTPSASARRDNGDKIAAYRPKSFTFNQSVATNTRFRREKSVLR